jgi:hypothetical protein
MKIFAKQNTELESVLKGFYEQMEREKTEVIEMVEKFTYAKPINFGYYWYFGITCVWAEDTIRFADITSPKNVTPYRAYGHTYFKPNKKTKAGKKFVKQWKEKFKGLDGKVLSDYGIPVYHENSGVYYNWLPIKDGERYGIEVASSIIDKMDKRDEKQFDIDV